MIGNEFTCQDRKGITVTCSRECWTKHVCIHAEMINEQGVVKTVISSPTSEYQDVRHVDKHNFYKNLVLPTVGNTLVKVCVEYSKQYGKERGFVRTAYATDRVKKGEIWLWGQKYVN